VLLIGVATAAVRINRSMVAIAAFTFAAVVWVLLAVPGLFS